MNYNPFLDTWFGNPWLCWGAAFLIYILGIVLFTTILKPKKTQKKKQKKNRILTALVYIIPMLIFFTNGDFNPIFFGYGSPVGISEVCYVDGKLYVVDYLRTFGGKTSKGTSYYRIHVIDPATGAKQRRFEICAGATFLGVYGDTIAVSHYSKDVTYYSASTGNIIHRYSKTTLAKSFPEFSSGVENFRWDGDGCTINVTTLDGNSWVLYPITKIVRPDTGDVASPVYQPTGRFYIDGNGIKIDNTNDKYGSDYLSIESKDGNSHKRYIYDSNDSIRLKEICFLDGYPVAVSEKDSCFVIMHYETTKNQRFILTGISFDGKNKRWQIKQSDLNPNYNFRYTKDIKIDFDQPNGRIFFAIRKEIFAVSMKDGKLLWRLKL